MEHHLLLALAMLGLLGSFAQWISWWLKLPAILFLLLIGLLLGPGLGVLNPDAVFGELLFPLVSLAVAVILFEGSLTLNFREISGVESVVLNLVSIGLLITWGIIAVATHFLMGFDWSIALLFGALVVVTGPTVIVPMLRTVRPTQNLANILRWEGIVIDPIGALLAVLVFEFMIASSSGSGLGHVLQTFAITILAGLFFGIAGGYGLGVVLRRYWLPEYLHNVVTLTLVFGIFAFSNSAAEESGLLAVTIMGMWLANMKGVAIDEILSFKESLSIFLISGLFILLAARLDVEQFMALGWAAPVVFLVIQFIARPAKVFVSTLGSSLSLQEKVLLSWIAPRGIVAAAVSALFAIKLEAHGYEQAPLLVSLTFLVIIGTVVLQSATARPLAQLLGVAEPEPRGVLIVGANKVAREIAQELNEEGFRTLLTDSYWKNIRDAKLAGLETFWGNAISERADHNLDLVGLGKLMGLSQNDHLNVLAAQRYTHEFGRNHIFTLSPLSNRNTSEKTLSTAEKRGAVLFNEQCTYAKLSSLLSKGAEIKTTKLSDEFGYQDYLEAYGDRVEPLFYISRRGNLHPFLTDAKHEPQAGSRIIGLITPEPEATE